MPDETTPPQGGETQQPDTESVTQLGPQPSFTAYHSTWMPAPGTWTSPGPMAPGTWTSPGPMAMGMHSTWMPAPALTTTLDADGKPKPGRYKVESHAVTEFEVLESGHVVVHRAEHSGGTPEPQE
jgi:hypothetical protein